MDFNKKEQNRLKKKPTISQTELQISTEASTHFNLYKDENQQDAVIEKDVNPYDSDKSAYLKEIHNKHSEILSNRPIPNLLDSASAIPSIEDISTLEKPEMGINLNQKKNLEKNRKAKNDYSEGHVA